MSDLHIGEIIRTRNIKQRFYSDIVIGELGFNAPKGQEFVLVLLGVTKQGGDFDARAALQRMGWTPPPSAAPMAGHESLTQSPPMVPPSPPKKRRARRRTA